MADISKQVTFPRWFLLGTAALMISSLTIAGVARLTGFGTSRVAQTSVSESIDILFIDQSDGSLKIVRASDNAELLRLASDGSGFLRGVARSLFRQRLLGKIERAEIFQLARRVDGKYFIADPALGSRMELDGFGPTNTQTVAMVLESGLKRDLGFAPAMQQTNLLRSVK